MTDWSEYLACGQCEAKMGDACYDLLGAGPEALPSRFREVPHGARKRRGEKVATAAVATRKTSQPVARRAARRTAVATSGWAAIAERQAAKKETDPRGRR